MQPMLRTDNCNLDLERGEIACSTEILRTLGVSESTYAMLGIAGSVLADGLGSGWLIQFLAWLWRRCRPEPKELAPS
jgi:hypothetical protein